MRKSPAFTERAFPHHIGLGTLVHRDRTADWLHPPPPPLKDQALIFERPLILLILVGLGIWLRVHQFGEWSLSGDEIYSVRAARLCASVWKGGPGTERGRGREPGAEDGEGEAEAAGAESGEGEAEAADAAGGEDEAEAAGAEVGHYPWAVRTNGLFYFATGASVYCLGDTPAAVRLPSLLAGLLALVLLPALAGRLWGRSFASVLLLFLALNPYLISMSRHARYETMVFLFSGVSILSLCIWARRPCFGWLSVAAVAGLAGMASHFSTALLVLVLATYAAYRAPPSRWSSRIVLLSVTAIAAAWLIPQAQYVASTVEQYIPRKPHSPHWGRLILSQAYNLGPLIVLAAVIGIKKMSRCPPTDRWPILGSLLLCGGGMLLLSLSNDIGIRYFSLIHPCVFVLATMSALPLLRSERPQRGAWLVAVVLLSQIPLLASNQIDDQRYDFRAAADYLKSAPDETGLVLAENHGTIEYYLRRDTEEIPKSIDDIEQLMEDRPDRSAHVVLLRQRGHIVHPQSSRLEDWLDQHAISSRVFGRRRWDDPVQRYEVEVYEVRVD